MGVARGRVATERDGIIAGGPCRPRRRSGGLSGKLPSSRSRWLRKASARRSCDCRRRTRRRGQRLHRDAGRDRPREGSLGYIGDGTNRWPAVHRLDSGHVFRLAMEKAPAGSALHAVAEEGVPVREIAEVIGRHLGLPVVAIAPEDAGEHFGCLAGFLAADAPASSELTRELLGWGPTRLGLLEGLDRGTISTRRGRPLLDRGHRLTAGELTILPSAVGIVTVARVMTQSVGQPSVSRKDPHRSHAASRRHLHPGR